MKSTKIFIMIGIVAGISFFVLTIAYVGQGNVRDTPLLRGEKVEQTIALEKINDELYVIGVSGIGGQNPTLIMRSDYVYFLNIITTLFIYIHRHCFLKRVDITNRSLSWF